MAANSDKEYDIAKQQLELLQNRLGQTNNKRRSGKKAAPALRPETVDEDATIQIEGEDGTYTIKIVEDVHPRQNLIYNGKTVAPPKTKPTDVAAKNTKVIKSKVVWDPETKDILNSSTSPKPAKRKKTEVDKLMADEGVVNMKVERRSTRSIRANSLEKQVIPKAKKRSWNADSMIVRRRSSSFSDDGIRTLMNETEDIKPETGANQGITKNLIMDMKIKLNQSMSEVPGILTNPANAQKTNHQIKVVKYEKLVHIQLNAINNNGHLTGFMCHSLAHTLRQLSNDASCSLVLISPLGSSYFGIDYNDVPVKRAKTDSGDPSTGLELLIGTLLHFKKPLAIGLDCTSIENMCVTMLPLFDIVFASKTTTFRITKEPSPDNGLGLAILQNCYNKVNPNLTARILYLEETVTAQDAFNGGLITKIIDDNFQEAVLSKCTFVASNTAQLIHSSKLKQNDRVENEISKWLLSNNN